MQRKSWLGVVALLSTALGCRELNRDYYCPAHRDDPRCKPEPERCGDIMCAAPMPVCETSTTTCVQCLVDTDCPTSAGVCNDQHACVECLVDDDCASQLCLADSKCAALDDVAYVGGDNPTDNMMCTASNPCQNITQGMKALGTRKYIKIAGPVIEPGAVAIDKSVTVYGRAGAKISRAAAGEVLFIKGFGAPEVTLSDLEIVGNVGSSGKDCVEISETPIVTMTRFDVHNHGQAGIALAGTAKLSMTESNVHDNGTDGIVATTGTTLEISRSKIYMNSGTAGVNATNAVKVTIDASVIAANSGTAGGASIIGPFSIKNSIIAANGNISTTTSAGGLTLNPVNPANAKFEFNTVAENTSSSPTTGLSCSNVFFDVSNSIFTGNTVNNCNISYSLITGTPSGTNKIGDPMFMSRTLLDPMFYRIGSLSAARDSADPAATLDVDIDGQARSDAQKDMGADEFR